MVEVGLGFRRRRHLRRQVLRRRHRQREGVKYARRVERMLAFSPSFA
jgi:hypothetical protein